MGSVIVGGARTPIGKLLGGLKDVSATRSWRLRDRGGARAFGRFAGARRLRRDGSGAASRHRSDPGSAGGGRRAGSPCRCPP